MRPACFRLYLRRFPLIIALSAFCCLLFLSGCSSTPATDAVASAKTTEHYQLPRKVAVFPFTNETNEPDAEKQVRRIFYNYFSSLNYRDVELSSVDEAINVLSLDINSSDFPWESLCQKLNIDGFVTGAVHEYGKTYAVLYSQTAVEMSVQFRSCHNGSYIWQRRADSTKRDGDIPLSPTSLAAAVFTTYFRFQDISALEVAARLSMDLTLSMPNPPSLLSAPPEVNFFIHNASGRLLLPGEYLKVVMRGAAGNRAFWSIPALAEKMPMEEKEAGVYIGQYQVKPEDRLSETLLEGYLVSNDNVETKWVDILEPVTMGKPTKLPEVIDGELFLSKEGSPYLIGDIVLVKKGAHLKVPAGTTIWSNGGGLVVSGQLSVLGEAQREVRFQGLSETPWKGITFNKSDATSVLRYVNIENAEIGLNVFESTVDANGVSCAFNTWGIVAQASQLTLANSGIRESRKVGIASRNSIVTLQQNMITGNQSGGLLLEKSDVDAEMNTITNNGLWEVNNLDADRAITLDQNWWGTTDIKSLSIKGSVMIEPLLTEQPKSTNTSSHYK